MVALGTIVVLIAFFLPWMHTSSPIANVFLGGLVNIDWSGWGLLVGLPEYGLSGSPAVLIIPLLALIALAMQMPTISRINLGNYVPIVQIGIGLFGIAYMLVNLLLAQAMINDAARRLGLPSILGPTLIKIEPAIGFWLTLLGFLLIVANAILGRRVGSPHLARLPSLGSFASILRTRYSSAISATQQPPTVPPQSQAVPGSPPAQTPTTPPSRSPATIGGMPSVGVPQTPSAPTGSPSPVAGWIPISTTPPTQTPPTTPPQATAGFIPSGATPSVNMPDTPKYFRVNRASEGAPFVFEWLPVRNAEGYVIEEADDTRFTQPREVYRGKDTRWTTVQTQVRFYRLCAFNSAGASVWTDYMATWP
jgi:hypothetical protein